MDELISRVLLVGGNAAERPAAVAALARTGARIILAGDTGHAIEELADAEDFPQLIIQHLDRAQVDEPLKLYRFARQHAFLRHIPFIFVAETEFENSMLKALKLTNYFCVLSPLSYASLIFALPALGIRIQDSILYHVPQMEENVPPTPPQQRHDALRP